MFTLTSEGVYESSVLCAIPRLAHGFGSRLAESWPGEYTKVKQIHSGTVLEADGRGRVVGDGDALVTGDPGQWIGIRTADCVPILIADRTHRAVGAIHAGWRGTTEEIAIAAVKKLTDLYGASPEDMVAAIGPCIGPCCFEVGQEVSDKFRPFFPEHNGEMRTVDLAEANRRQLLAAGLEPASIDSSRICTKCDSERFHSYRRDRDLSGRMVAAIRIKP